MVRADIGFGSRTVARIESLCISQDKGEQKQLVDEASFRDNYGIADDAHAGSEHRQVSLLALDDIESVRKTLPDVRPGAFAENVVISGVNLAELGLGSRLRLGETVVVSVTQIGKECHTPCRIGQITGDCIMPRLGLFARVETGGTARVGEEVQVLETISARKFQAVVLTISDRCARGEATDTAGPSTAKLLAEQLDCHIYRVNILPDEQEVIAERLRHYCDGHSMDLVMTVGGTGFSPRDVTPEATRQVIERLTPGLDEVMRAKSLAKTPHAMLSRGCSGIRGRTLILNLPGSERAAKENLQVILPALGHGLNKLRGDSSDCGRSSQTS